MIPVEVSSRPRPRGAAFLVLTALFGGGLASTASLGCSSTGAFGGTATGGSSASGGASQSGGTAGGTGGTVGSGGGVPATGGTSTSGAAGGSGGGGPTDAAVGDANPAGTGGAAAGGRGAGGAVGPGGAGGGQVVVSPVADGYQMVTTYPAPPEATRRAGVPQATLDAFVFTSSFILSSRQTGPTSRNVKIFIPAQYVAGTEVPFMVIQDGDEQIDSFHTNIVMENLIFQKRLPVMAAVFVHNPGNFVGPQRSLEYDCLDADYSNFVMTELLPAVKARHPELNLTADPNGRGAMGKSSGAPASFTLGWLHPELYRRILTLNGSFVNQCADGPGALGYPNLIRMTDPAKPLRVYLFSGSMDNNGYAAANQAMADALEAKGYPWRYVFGVGAQHANNFGASLVTEALLWIWAGYPI